MPARSCRRAAAPSRRAATRSSRPARLAHANGSLSQPSLVERLADAARGDLRLAHCLDHGRAAIRRVTGREVLRVRGAAEVVDLDEAAVELEAVDPREELRARSLADCLDRGVDREHELRSGDLLRAPAPARIRIAEPRTAALDAREAVPADEAQRHGEPLEADTFLERLVDLVPECRHLGARAPVEQRHGVGAETDRLARDVDGRVAAADDRDRRADVERMAGLDRLDERERLPD